MRTPDLPQTRRLGLAIGVLFVCSCVIAGCGAQRSGSADGSPSHTGSGKAQSLDVDSTDDTGDIGREPTGCSVEDQEPAGGDTAAEGDEITLTLDRRQVDWEDQEGDLRDNFSTAYSDGFNAACDALFDLSPDGSLYVGDTEYTNVDCTNLEPDPADAPTEPTRTDISSTSDRSFSASF
jgi:hypothetical protein